jgi:M6 family metalloprotease-like protein
VDGTRSFQSRDVSPFLGLLLASAFTGILWLVVAVLYAGTASAVPARQVVNQFTQPDGSTFKARLVGDEWSNGYETLRGYTIVKNTQSGYWEYAVRSGGKLVASGRPAHQSAPSGLKRHVRKELTGQVAAAARVHHGFAEPDSPNVGSQPAIVLLVDYDNQPGTTTEANWASKFFGATNSVNDYYDEVSYGLLDFPAAAETSGTPNNGVVGWLRLSGNHPNNEGNIDDRNRSITRNAIIKSNPFVDYSSFDSNSDGAIQRSELHITVIVAGYETSYDNPCGRSVWGHNWGLGGTVTPPIVDGVTVGGVRTDGGYNQFGERHCTTDDPSDDHMATIGIMVHEMGHDLNLPDLYDTDGGSIGIGEWSVMAAGSWTAANSTDPAGSSPVHMDAFSKWYEGWLTPTQIHGNQGDVELTEMSSAADVYQLLTNPRAVDWTFNQRSGAGEYFLVENRQLSGYDAGLPGCGVLIWHIDETRRSDNFANATESRKLVDLEEADGFNHLDNGTNLGDDGDPYRGLSFFGATSNPNSNLYSGAPSNVIVNNISSMCAATMSADIVAPFGLTVAKGGTGTGTVTSSAIGINCGADCTQDYTEGNVVTLTATPTNGSRFDGWTGDCTGAASCQVTMDAARNVTATFTGPTTTTLSITKTDSKIKASGQVQPAHVGNQVTVTLYKRRANGTWGRIATNIATLKSSSRYTKSFSRPSSGSCKITTRFAADSDHLGSRVTKQFRC